MKKNIKRLLALVMVFAMALSCMTFASAAYEPVEDDSYSSNVQRFHDKVDQLFPESVQAMTALTDVKQTTNFTTGQVVSAKFDQSVPANKYITVVIGCDAPVTVSIVGFLGKTISRYITPGEVAPWTIAASTVTTSVLGAGYEIRFHSSGSVAVYQFFATDEIYNG